MSGRARGQVRGQPGPGDAGRGPGDVPRRALGDDMAAVRSPARAHVDEIVGHAEQVEVVVDDDDGGPGVQQPVENADERAHVKRVQPGRRLVEHVEHTALAAAQSRGDAQPLRLAAGQRRRGLAEPQVPQADLVDGP